MEKFDRPVQAIDNNIRRMRVAFWMLKAIKTHKM
jgi:hypothetical protein